MTKSKNKFVSLITDNAIIVILILMAVYVALVQPRFMSGSNWTNIAINTSCRFIIALGVSGCLITKGTDLSAGRMVGLAACICGTLLQKVNYSGKFFPNLGDFPVIAALVIAVAVCTAFGTINGLVIAYLKVPPFIATLGMQIIVYGSCLVYTGAQPLGGYKKTYTSIATGKLFGKVPYLFIIALVFGIAIWFLYKYTRHGKYMYAIGGNESAAEVSGVNVNKTLILIYAKAAAMYAIAGFLLGAKAGGATVNTGQGYELEAIAACTIGGVSTTGGVGTVPGVLIGVLVFEILKSSLQFLKVDTSWQYIVQGLVIIVAVALDIRKYLSKK